MSVLLLQASTRKKRIEKLERTASVLCNRDVFLSLSTISFNNMKRFYKKILEFKKRSLGSKHGPGPATSASDTTACAQFTAGVNVSVQLELEAPIASLKY